MFKSCALKFTGGIEALLPSLGALIVVGFGVYAKLGYRGRPTVAGVDLGTTNSVICIQQQSKGGKFISSVKILLANINPKVMLNLMMIFL